MPPPPAREPDLPDPATVAPLAPPRPRAGPPPRVSDPRLDGAVPLDIDWISAMRDAALPENRRRLFQAGGFLAANGGAIDSLVLPVLLPDDPAQLKGSFLFVHGDFYSLTYSVPGASVMLTGYARAFPLPDGAANVLPRGGFRSLFPADGVIIGNTEVGIDADFQRYGAVYGISVDCDDFESDPRCTSEDFIRGLMSRLAVAIPRSGG